MKTITKTQFDQIVSSAYEAYKNGPSVSTARAVPKELKDAIHNLYKEYEEEGDSSIIDRCDFELIKSPNKSNIISSDAVMIREGCNSFFEDYFANLLAESLPALAPDHIKAELHAFNNTAMQLINDNPENPLPNLFQLLKITVKHPFWQKNKVDFLKGLLLTPTVFHHLQQNDQTAAIEWYRQLVILFECSKTVLNDEMKEQLKLNISAELNSKLWSNNKAQAFDLATHPVAIIFVLPALFGAASLLKEAVSPSQANTNLATQLADTVSTRLTMSPKDKCADPKTIKTTVVELKYRLGFSEAYSAFITSTVTPIKQAVMNVIRALEDPALKYRLLSEAIDPHEELGNFMDYGYSRYKTTESRNAAGTRQGIFADIKEAGDVLVSQFIQNAGEETPTEIISQLTEHLDLNRGNSRHLGAGMWKSAQAQVELPGVTQTKTS